MIKKILIIGNGATGIDEFGMSFVNVHTGKFLRNLRKKGYNVSFFQFAEEHDLQSNLRGYCLDNYGITSLTIKADKVSFLINFFWLIRLILKSDFVYVFMPGKLGKVVASICFVLNKKFALYVRGELFGSKGIDRWIITKAKFVLTVSPALQIKIAAFNSDVEVIKPMTNLSIEHKYDRKDLQRKPDIWNILFVGRIEERKGVLELVEVSRYLNSYGIQHTLKIVGGGPLLHSLQKQKFNNILPDSITLMGHIDDYELLLKLYEEADLFLFLSHDEGFPRTLYEAMIKSLPIFTTLVGGIPGRMLNGVNCFEVPLKNPQGVSKVLKNKLTEIDALNRVAKNGLETALDVLSSNLTHEELLHEKVKDYA